MPSATIRLTHVQFNMSCCRAADIAGSDRRGSLSCGSPRLLRERGLTMAAISGTFNLCDPDASRLEDNLATARCPGRGVSLAGYPDHHALHGHSRPRRHVEMASGQRAAQYLGDSDRVQCRQAVKIADRHEVTLAFEPEIHNVVNSVSKARRLLDEIGSRGSRSSSIPANLIRPGERSRIPEILDEAFDWLGRDIVLAHAKDPQFDNAGDDAVAAREFFDFAERGEYFMLEAAGEFLDFAQRIMHVKHVKWNMPRKEQRPIELPKLRESLIRRFFYFWGFFECAM